MGILATFGVGFLFGPLGGIFFGHFDDWIGRKKCWYHSHPDGAATIRIGLLSNFERIVRLCIIGFLRAIQGLAVVREWGGATLIAVENAPDNKKAFYSSGVQVGYGVGLVLATAAVSIVIAVFGELAFT